MSAERMAEELAVATSNQSEVQGVSLVDEDLRSGGYFFDVDLKDGRALTVLVVEVHR